MPRPKNDTPSDRLTVYLTSDEKQWCKQQPGGGSEYVKRLIAIDRAQHEAKELLADPEARDLVAAILEGFRGSRVDNK
jgi:hypothetical protein